MWLRLSHIRLGFGSLACQAAGALKHLQGMYSTLQAVFAQVNICITHYDVLLAIATSALTAASATKSERIASGPAAVHAIFGHLQKLCTMDGTCDSE